MDFSINLWTYATIGTVLLLLIIVVAFLAILKGKNNTIKNAKDSARVLKVESSKVKQQQEEYERLFLEKNRKLNERKKQLDEHYANIEDELGYAKQTADKIIDNSLKSRHIIKEKKSIKESPLEEVIEKESAFLNKNSLNICELKITEKELGTAVSGGDLELTFMYEEREYALHILECIKQRKEVHVNRENSDVFYRICSLIISGKQRPKAILSFFQSFKPLVVDDRDSAQKTIDGYILDCYALLGDYESYIEARKDYSELGSKSHTANVAINVHYQAGIEPNVLDLMWLTGCRKGKYIKENASEFLTHCKNIFDDYSANNKGWFNVMKDHGLLDVEKQKYAIYAFSGSYVNNMTYPFSTFCFYTSEEFNALCARLQRDAESGLRVGLGLKPVGQGWVSETDLFLKIKEHFPQYEVIQHGKPKWLGRQHLDVWIPEILVAVEYHGKQHFEPVEFFGGEDAFLETVKRDKKKEKLCSRNDVLLIAVAQGYDIESVFSQIEEWIA